MHNIQKHSIGSCRWVTHLDAKDYAFDLQSRVSNWSKHHLPREADRIFNELCPKEHTIVIEALELDLGKLNYNHLEDELSRKFTETLKNAIHELIHDPKKNQNQLRIVTKDQVYLEQLHDFLRFGYVQGAFNRSLEDLIDEISIHSRIEMIALIKQSVKDEAVRKRIAWQFKDATIKDLLKDLEPSNHAYVIEFSEQIIQVQKKEAVVKTSMIDFRKNLWLWIFNYLFVERGTMFNKMAFVKSTLRQMAQHFNLEYDQLFELIEAAITKVNHDKRNEFLHIIKSLSRQRQNLHFSNKATTKQTEHYWSDLKALLSNKSPRLSTQKTMYLNELVVHLYHKDASRFRALLKSLKITEAGRNAITSELNEEVLEVIFIALNPNNGKRIFNDIWTLEAFGLRDTVSHAMLWRIALSFASDTRTKLYTQEALLDNVLTQLTKNNSSAKHQLLQDILNTNLNREKSTSAIKTRRILVELYQSTLQKTKSSVKEKRIRHLLHENHNANRQELLLMLRSEPEFAAHLLTKESIYVQQLMQVLDAEELQTLFKTAKKAFWKNLSPIIKALNDLEKQYPKLSGYSIIKGLVIPSALKVLNNNHLELATSELVGCLIDKMLLEALASLSSTTFLSAISGVLERLVLTGNISKPNAKIIIDDVSNRIKDKTTLDFCLMGIKHKIKDKGTILKTMFALVEAQKANPSRLKANEAILLNYIFGINTIRKAAILRNFKASVLKTNKHIKASELNQFLEALYWRGLFQYTFHKGDIDKWLSLLQQSINHKFLVTKQQISDKTKDAISLKREITIKDLEVAPEVVYDYVQKTNDDEGLISALGQHISVQQFNAFLSHVTSQRIRNYLNLSFKMFNALESLSSLSEMRQLTKQFWMYSIHLIKQKDPGKLLRTLIDAIFEVKNQNPSFDKDKLVDVFVNQGIHEFIQMDNEPLDAVLEASNDVNLGLRNDNVERLIEFIFNKEELPIWYVREDHFSVTMVVEELFTTQPHKVLKLLRRHPLWTDKLMRLCSATLILDKLEYLYVGQSRQLKHIKILYRLFEQVSISQLSGKTMQKILLKIVLNSWLHSNWDAISESKLWMELLWALNKRQSLSKTTFINAMDSIAPALPTALSATLKLLNDESKPNVLDSTAEATILSQGIAIPNAGLVLLNTYFKMLFERLELVSEHQFISMDHQIKAVHYLQFIVTGQTKTPEHLLVLNKVLCGLEPSTPIPDTIDIRDDEKTLIEGMISSAIAYWTAIGDSSVDGFRGNWLVRDGILREEEDRWQLTVEKRSYDILMQRSPFSFSIIKLPWMTKPMHIQWPF